jgi:hypothetical protein
VEKHEEYVASTVCCSIMLCVRACVRLYVCLCVYINLFLLNVSLKYNEQTDVI